MLRYKTVTRPGLVALYDIRPGNGVGQILQPQSPHGASVFVLSLMYILRSTGYFQRLCLSLCMTIFFQFSQQPVPPAL